MDIHFGLELIAITTYAINGALKAIEKRMDLYGTVMLGIVTALGGGIIRDLVLGIHPPMSFQKPVYILSAFVAVLLFVSVMAAHRRIRRRSNIRTFLSQLYYLLDVFGLGLFSVVGISIALKSGYEGDTFILVFAGLTTGVGGGVLRDVLVGSVPAIFKSKIYAVSSIIGCLAFLLAKDHLSELAATVIGISVILILSLTTHYLNINLPVIKLGESEKKEPPKEMLTDKEENNV